MFTGDYTFLTTKPMKRLMSRQHPEILSVLPHVDQAMVISGKATYQNTTEATVQIASFTGRIGEVYMFLVGIQDVAFVNKDLIKKIEVFIGDYATAEEIITYYPVNFASDDLTAIYYYNSFGGLDSLFCTGMVQRTQNISSTLIRTGRTLAIDNESRSHRRTSTSAKFGNQVRTGFSSKGELDALQDLFLINHAYEYKSVGGVNSFLPIDIDTNVNWPDSKTDLQALPISYQYSTDMKAITRIV